MNKPKYWIVFDESTQEVIPGKHLNVGSAKETATTAARETPTHKIIVFGAEFSYSTKPSDVTAEEFGG